MSRVLEVAWWPSIRRDVEKFVRACPNGQRYRGNVGRAAMGGVPSPRKPFDLVAMDVIGPFRTTVRRNRFVLVMICHYTR